MLRHERLTVAMALAEFSHHSSRGQRMARAGVWGHEQNNTAKVRKPPTPAGDLSVQVGSPFAPVTEYVAPAPAVTLSVPSQQLRPACTSATVTTGVNLDVSGFVSPLFSRSAVEVSASQVVDPLPPAEEFSETVCNQVHRVRLTAGETAENLVEIPDVQEQAIGQAIVVVGSLPPSEEFTVPVYNHIYQGHSSTGETTELIAEFPVVPEQVIVRVAGTPSPVGEFSSSMYHPVHQEQFSAGDTTENIPDFPVVQEQVLVQAIPRLVGSSPPVDEFTAYVAMRPLPLVEVQPSVRAQRHIVEDLGELAPLVQILDLPVPQLVDNVVDALRIPERPMTVQVIEVPKILVAVIPARSLVPEPQSAEQLVEVPTVLSPTRIALQIAEQIVDTPVPQGRGGKRRVQGFSPRTEFKSDIFFFGTHF